MLLSPELVPVEKQELLYCELVIVVSITFWVRLWGFWVRFCGFWFWYWLYLGLVIMLIIVVGFYTCDISMVVNSSV